MFKYRLKYKLLLLIAAVSVLIYGCSKDFLDVPVQGQATADSDPDVADKLVTGVYASLHASSAFGGIGDINGISMIAATTIITDDSDKGSTPGDQKGLKDMDDFDLTPTNNFVAALWTGYFNGIAKTNQALKALETAKLDEDLKLRYQAEVRFFRGYYYFNLVRWFGGVPKVLKVPLDAYEANNDPVYQTRATPDEIYALIIEDLTFAKENLLIKGVMPVGRVTKGTATAMLAKVYLTRKNWQEAYTLSQEVISSGSYSLLPDYSEIWRQVGDRSNEAIFEVQTGVYNNSDYGVPNYCVWQGPRVGGLQGWTDLGFGFNSPSQNLVNDYEAGDKRKESTIIFIDQSPQHVGTVLFDGFRIPSQDSVANPRYNYKAYHSENKEVESFLGNRDRKQKNIHLLRYADVILMAAEAANELGNSGESAMLINMIRQRAGLADIIASSQPSMRETVYHERRIELAMEHDRWFDLIRTGRAAQVMQAVKPNFIPGKNELLPIPSLQIALSGGKLIQNPLY
ncbi:MAG: RagB/SusD family nutrient uptake outer membrane protein [Saprospiraceae bacterium]|nr:RagB/SusD family nutrient uptake outer membrane protein [Candidatus Brachybacter algidus]